MDLQPFHNHGALIVLSTEVYEREKRMSDINYEEEVAKSLKQHFKPQHQMIIPPSTVD